MTLPALQKTWQGGSSPGGTEFVNQLISEGTGDANNAAAMLAIKEALVGFNSNPWTVVGSSDGVASSMDGTDRWADTGDLIWSNLGAFSWIVLQQTNINTKTQLLLSLGEGFTYHASISVSPSAGFGAVNGGTDGSTTAAPTATDEHALLTSNQWYGNMALAEDTILTCISSTDGECTRIIGSRAANNVMFMRLNIEKPRSPVASWANPVVYSHESLQYTGSDTAFQLERWMNEQTFLATIPGDGENLQVAMRFSGPMRGSFEVIDQEQISGNARLYGGTLVHDDGDAGWGWGTLFDCYWVTKNVSGAHAALLDSMPSGGDRSHVCVGDIVYGWLDDGVTDVNIIGAEYLAHTVGTLANGAGGSMTIGKPSGVQEGDILLFYYLGDGSTASISSRPSGFNSHVSNSANMDGGPAFKAIDYKVAGASEPANYTWTRGGGSADSIYVLIAYRPSVAGDPFDPDSSTGAVVGGAIHNSSGLVTTLPQTRIVNSWMANRTGGTGALTISSPPAGNTQRALLDGSGIGRADLNIALYDEPKINEGAALSRQLTWDLSADGFVTSTGIQALGAL
jgi:hypothetical protein